MKSTKKVAMNELPPTREILWNISSVEAMYAFFTFSLVIFIFGASRHFRGIKKGKPLSGRFSHPLSRTWKMAKAVFLQDKTFNILFPGIFHGLIFYSFLVLFLTTLVILFDADFNTDLYRGPIYIVLTLGCEIAGVMMLAGIMMALWRRLFIKPGTLGTTGADLVLLLLMAAIVMTGYLVEGARIAVNPDGWARLSFVGYGVSFLFTGARPNVHEILWWLHTFLVLGWVAIIPFTKFAHFLLLPANSFFEKQGPRGKLDRIDIEALMENDDLDETELTFGIGSSNDLTWKHYLDLFACMDCGRCESVCPAYSAEQPLSPKDFIRNMLGAATSANRNKAEAIPEGDSDAEFVGNAFNEDFIWYCRTCMACVEICPAFIEHVDTLIDVRRNEVNMKGRLPTHAATALKTMESLGSPFGPVSERIKWTQGLEVPVVQAGEQCDVLYWTGCLTAMDHEKQHIAVNLCHIMAGAGVNYGILGEDETCCGDPARVMGEENLFQMTAKLQTGELNARKFNTLLVACPHGYTVLKDEYPQFGGHYHVMHYTEFLYKMLCYGKIQPREDISVHTVAYHDPCYLGRYQNIYDAPRKLIDAVSGIERIELPKSGGKSFCCGGGGGHFWMDFKEGKKINVLRIEQAIEAGAEMLVTSCPYCLHMLNDGVKIMDMESKITVNDITTLFHV